MVINC